MPGGLSIFEYSHMIIGHEKVKTYGMIWTINKTKHDEAIWEWILLSLAVVRKDHSVDGHLN